MAKENKKRWSKKVTETSRALMLEEGVFTWKDPKKIAASLKASALKSHVRQGTPYQSAMSMLNFYINRAGKNLSQEQHDILTQVKEELRITFKHKN
jgi:hypothetical protein